jgi:hypothetical protein
MQRTPAEHYAAPSKATALARKGTDDHVAQFTPARDSRNCRVPGLYVRNSRYYCQLWIDRGDGRKSARRFPLFNSENLPARNLNEAKEALEIKRNDRREDRLPTPGRKPNFLDYSETYMNKAKVQRKRPGTLQNEQQAIARLRSHLGHVRIDKIATPMVASFVEKRCIEFSPSRRATRGRRIGNPRWNDSTYESWHDSVFQFDSRLRTTAPSQHSSQCMM